MRAHSEFRRCLISNLSIIRSFKRAVCFLKYSCISLMRFRLWGWRWDTRKHLRAYKCIEIRLNVRHRSKRATGVCIIISEELLLILQSINRNCYRQRDASRRSRGTCQDWIVTNGRKSERENRVFKRSERT